MGGTWRRTALEVAQAVLAGSCRVSDNGSNFSILLCRFEIRSFSDDFVEVHD